MKQLLILALLFVTATTHVQAHSWRVNNIVTKKADFPDINAAMASEEVADGDTLYLDPGSGMLSDQTVSKQVTIIGCGYFRPGISHGIATILDKLVINAAYTKVEGVSFVSTIYIQAPYVTIERCKVDNDIYVKAQYATIRQCYGARVVGKGGSDKSSAYCTIENSIFRKNCYDGVVASLFYPTIRNCYLRQSLNADDYYSMVIRSCKYTTVINSILVNTARRSQIWYDSSSDLNQNNITSATEGHTEAAIFALEGDGDCLYQLKEDSPARGAAQDGGDCGPFGGLYPYVIGGLPARHPYYTKAVISPLSEDDKVKVSLQIKMQNE